MGKWSDSGYVLKAKPKDFANGVNEHGCERMKGLKDDLQAFDQKDWKDRVAIYREEKGWNRFWKVDDQEFGFGCFSWRSVNRLANRDANQAVG